MTDRVSPGDLKMTTTHRALASIDEWQEFARKHPQLTALDAFIIDVNGNTLGKRLAIADAHKAFTDGVQYSSCALIADVRGLGHNVQGMGASDGDPDGTALPIAGTLHLVPWAHASTAQVLCNMRHVEHRRPLWFDPREVLQAVLERCQQKHINPVVACELEFYLVDPRRTENGAIALATLPGRGSPPRRAANLSMDAIEDAAAFLNRVSEAAAAQGVPACGAVAEYGIGQYEINLRHVADPLLAADHAVLLKRIIKGVAQSMGMLATFMAKPFAQQAGSGLHVHVSIADAARVNRFGLEGGETLLQEAVAGMQALMFDSLGLCAPGFNSYRRYLGPFVPTTRDWGHNNRAVAFRVPAAHGSGRRIEHRVAGADASPHLVIAAILAAVLHGVTEHLKPTAPAVGRVQSGPDPTFPNGLLAALERLEHSSLLSTYIPGKFLQLFAELKRKEYAAVIEELFIREFDFYL
jgi:glutamine synthetase